MNLAKKLRERRVPQYVSAYIVGSWGLLQFTAFLESRMQFSPQVVNLITLSLVCLFPGVCLLAWRHGRPGHDEWKWIEKIGIPLNLIATVLICFFVFKGKDFSAMTKTVTVATEEGEEIERVIPRNEYGRQVFINYFENEAGETEEWLTHGLAMMMHNDLIQDPFVISAYPIHQTALLQDLGFGSGFDLSLGKQRQLARKINTKYFTSGSCAKTESGWKLSLRIHDSKAGRKLADLSFEGEDVVELADKASRQLRLGIGIPASHVDQQPDLTIREILSENDDAMRLYSEGMLQATHDNDWQSAKETFRLAVVEDEEFALAQFMYYAARLSTGEKEEDANTSMMAALDHVYRLPERLQFATKSVYYFNVVKDPDSTMAITDMWIKLYPNDVAAYSQKLQFSIMRNDTDTAIATLERMVEIAPYQHLYLLQLATICRRNQRFEQAEQLYQQYTKLFPAKPEGYSGLAELYRDSGELAKAKDNLEQAMLLEPGNSELLVDLALLERRLGNFEKAEKLCDDALAIAKSGADNITAWSGKMSIYAASGRMQDAWEALDHQYEYQLKSEQKSNVNLQYGFDLVNLLTTENAPEIREKLQELDKDIIEVNRRLTAINEALAAIYMGDAEVANSLIDTCESFVEEYKYEVIRPQINYARGKLAHATGKIDEATDYLALAVEGAPTRVSWLATYAELILEIGNLKKAETELNRLKKLDPGRPWVRLLEAKLYLAKGNKASAAPLLANVNEALKGADKDYLPAIEAKQLLQQ